MKILLRYANSMKREKEGPVSVPKKVIEYLRILSEQHEGTPIIYWPDMSYSGTYKVPENLMVYDDYIE